MSGTVVGWMGSADGFPVKAGELDQETGETWTPSSWSTVGEETPREAPAVAGMDDGKYHEGELNPKRGLFKESLLWAWAVMENRKG